MTHVIVLQGDYSGTYFATFGGVYGPYDAISDAEKDLQAAGFKQHDDGEWLRQGHAWEPGERASIIELARLTGSDEKQEGPDGRA